MTAPAPVLSARDQAALRVLLGMRGPDGWARPRARGQLTDASGLSWQQWRRAVRSLASYGLVEIEPTEGGSRGTVTPIRVTEAGMSTASIDAVPTPCRRRADAPSYSSLTLESKGTKEEEVFSGGVSIDAVPTPWTDAVRIDAVADAVRYLADLLSSSIDRLGALGAQARSASVPRIDSAERTAALALPDPECEAGHGPATLRNGRYGLYYACGECSWTTDHSAHSERLQAAQRRQDAAQARADRLERERAEREAGRRRAGEDGGRMDLAAEWAARRKGTA